MCSFLISLGYFEWRFNSLHSDISNGREHYPIEVVRRPRIGKISNEVDDETILPDFKYITKSILLQNSVQIDYRVSQMRICSCNDR